MIAIIDYGLGNIKAFENVYKRLNISCCLARSSKELENVTKIILPGVGAFDHAMSMLNDSGMRELLEIKVLRERVPVLGICVGMQMLANSSDEGKLDGLGWISGTVKKFTHSGDEAHKYPLPHMGWNSIEVIEEDDLVAGLSGSPQFYFLHSYYFQCEDDKQTIARADYGGNFSCIIKHENIYGIQCHPEKSHHNGVALLKNFSEI